MPYNDNDDQFNDSSYPLYNNDDETQINDALYNENSDVKPGLFEKNELKELEILDGKNNKNLFSIPTTVKVPTKSGDEIDLENKKILTDKSKFLGIGQIPFFIIIGIIIIILITALVGLSISAYYFATDPDVNYEWKLFGLVVCSCGILISIAVLIFIVVYACYKRKKHKKAYLEEVNASDENGNPTKSGALDKIYKFSKPKPKPHVIHRPQISHIVRKEPTFFYPEQSISEVVLMPPPVVTAPTPAPQVEYTNMMLVPASPIIKQEQPVIAQKPIVHSAPIQIKAPVVLQSADKPSLFSNLVRRVQLFQRGQVSPPKIVNPIIQSPTAIALQPMSSGRVVSSVKTTPILVQQQVRQSPKLININSML